MNKILLTGCDGFIGKNLQNSLMIEGYDIDLHARKDGDLSIKTTWEEKEYYPTVIHLAAKTFVPFSWDSPAEFIRNNTLSTTYALEYCRDKKSKLILLSSYMYGNTSNLPTSEKEPLSVSNPYGLSKLLCENICDFYSEIFNVKVIRVRVFNVFGPGQPSNFLISKIVSQALNNKQIYLENLEPRRDYIYIRDLCSAIIKIIKYESNERIFNIGQGKSYSVSKVVEIVQSILGTNKPCISKKQIRKMEILETLADIELAKKELKWYPKYDLKKGLSEYIKFEKNEKKI